MTVQTKEFRLRNAFAVVFQENGQTVDPSRVRVMTMTNLAAGSEAGSNEVDFEPGPGDFKRAAMDRREAGDPAQAFVFEDADGRGDSVTAQSAAAEINARMVPPKRGLFAWALKAA